MNALSLAVLVAAVPAVLAVNVQGRQMHLEVEVSRPKKNCRRHKRHAAMVQRVNSTANSSIKLPGTGMDTAVSSGELSTGTLYMDGFSNVGCIKDYMFYHGDKHGDNKYSYEIGDTSRVSITIYNDMVPKEDQQAMTPDVCFDFCRVQKHMSFFGIQNGRTCYCAPFVEAMSGDDAVCDAPCEGDAGVICGSKSKSTAFEMHSCDDTAEQLTTALTTFTELTAKVKTSATALKTSAAYMITKSNSLQESFGKAGDPVVGDLFQKALVSATDAQEVATKALDFETAQAGLVSTAEALKSKDMSAFENANAADEAIALIAKGTAGATTQLSSVNTSASEYMPYLLTGAPASKEEAKQYYNIMYFIDRSYENTTATCGGDIADVDMGLTKDGCAAKCDDIDSAQTPACVGFLYVPGEPKGDLANLPDSFCFMFGKFTSVQYYTGCNTTSLFLQAKRADKGTMCYGKLSKFSGGAPVLDKEKGQKATEASQRCVPV
mmetsp:Transcript_116283/g.205621  ORF Transcript_116283/g.205621 Transcript_116283/m.205621 type:complete len:492 (-) Transcript_116283:94-1569(-)